MFDCICVAYYGIAIATIINIPIVGKPICIVVVDFSKKYMYHKEKQHFLIAFFDCAVVVKCAGVVFVFDNFM